MRVSFIQLVLIAALAGMAYAGDVVAQNLLNRKISLQVDEQEVKTVLRQLEKQADVRFIYSPQVVPANRKVSLNVTNQSLADVLTSLLKPMNVSYEVKGKQILLDKAPETGQLELRSKTVALEVLARTITGTVTDFENKQPIPGVTVVVKGTTKGTATDGSGVYSLRVDDADQTLVFSFVGYEPQEVAIANRTTIAVSLKPDIKALSEVVVVGYGTQRKTSTTAAVSTVKGDELKAAPVANINNSISGRVSGVLSFQGSGEPGKDASTLRVRGLGTTGSQNGALTIVDGIPRPFAQLNPNEIESITVLKDAAAVAPYGVAGANGVVQAGAGTGERAALEGQLPRAGVRPGEAHHRTDGRLHLAITSRGGHHHDGGHAAAASHHLHGDDAVPRVGGARFGGQLHARHGRLQREGHRRARLGLATGVHRPEAQRGDFSQSRLCR